MNEVAKRGKMSEKVGDALLLRDTYVSNIVKNALRDNGFGLIVRQKVDPGTNMFIGEEIEVFREII